MKLLIGLLFSVISLQASQNIHFSIESKDPNTWVAIREIQFLTSQNKLVKPSVGYANSTWEATYEPGWGGILNTVDGNTRTAWNSAKPDPIFSFSFVDTYPIVKIKILPMGDIKGCITVRYATVEYDTTTFPQELIMCADYPHDKWITIELR